MADFTKDSLPWDKLMHIVMGAVISALLISFIPELKMYAFLITVVIGGLKEVLWDGYLKKGTPEFWDFVATTLGVVLVMIGYLSGVNIK